jgi:diphthine-ammonia ligase
MKVGVLFSGGKDSCYSIYLAKEYGYNVSCLITLESNNKESYMFHTPSISKVEFQAKAQGIPIIIKKTAGVKEKELIELEEAIKQAIDQYGVDGIVSGAIESVYQATRIQTTCNKLGIECFNPLWQKDQIEILEDLIKDKFEVIITGVFAYPLDEKWLGKKIDKQFITEITKLSKEYKINPAGEGGEYESLVINCPLFKKRLKITGYDDYGEGNSIRREVLVE